MLGLLIDEPPLQVLPSLATAIGVNEALILQQIHYWLQRNGKERDGRLWTYNSYPEWQKQFPFFSERTIQRLFKSLEAKKLLVVGNYNKMAMDRTKWYSINYEAITKMERTRRQVDVMENDSLTSPIPETIHKINTSIYTVFDYWNKTKVIVHRTMSDKLRGHINSSLTNHSVEEITKAIANYSTVLNSEQYYWTHKWTLGEFLLRGLDKFLDENKPLENFLSNKKDKPIQPKSNEDSAREIIAKARAAAKKESVGV